MDANEIRVEGFKYRVISIFPDGSYTNKPQGLVAEALYSDRVVGRRPAALEQIARDYVNPFRARSQPNFHGLPHSENW